VRPEDLHVDPAGLSLQPPFLWRGQVDQSMDMGHYRKLLVNLGERQELVTVYVAKAQTCSEGAWIALAPARFLAYQGSKPPVEVRMNVPAGHVEGRRDVLPF
jgi:hypothetical protein